MVARRFILLLAGAVLWTPAVRSQQVTDPNGDVFLGGPKYKKPKKATSRTLRGTVTDANGKPLAGALVTLNDVAKAEKITFVTKGDGRYSFDDLPFRVEYEVSAQFGDQHSETKKLSQYDDATPAVRMLEVDTQKSAEKH